MRMLIITLVLALILIGCCFLTWATIESKGLTISGMDTTGTSFGKPGYLHIILAISVIVLILFRRSWAHKVSIFVGALNLAWAFRNFILVPMCRGGVCPEKHPAIYIVLISSILLLVFLLFIPMKAGDPAET